MDAYFSVDVETDGPIPGPYSMLSMAFVFAGTFDGIDFLHPIDRFEHFYSEVRPISENFESDALSVNGIDRQRLVESGAAASDAMDRAYEWILRQANGAEPVLVAYPLSFDWSWVYWYFVRFCRNGSPFNHSRCFDLKTAYAVKAGLPISEAGRSKLMPSLRSARQHSHHALDDAIEQAEIFAKVFLWGHALERASSTSSSNYKQVQPAKEQSRQS